MLRFVILCTAVMAYVLAATTTTHRPHGHHNPNTTKEPSEHDSFRFQYEVHSHKMVVVTGQICYVFVLTDDERVAVHTDAGIQALELKLLGLISTGTKTLVASDQLEGTVQKTCGRHTTDYYMVA